MDRLRPDGIAVMLTSSLGGTRELKEFALPIPPPPGVPISLSAATPSVINPDSLKTQLENVGLDCSEITTQFLQEKIVEVNSQLQRGQIQSFAILAPAGSVQTNTLPPSLAADADLVARQAAERQADPEVGSLAAVMSESQEAAIGNWTENDRAQGYAPNLEVIQWPAHFEWLMSQKDSNAFPGIVDAPPAYTGNYPNAAAIQKLFINVAYSASSTVVAGIDQATMESVFSNVIQPLSDANLKNYNQPGSRTIMLVENYNTTTGYADAVGAVTVDWRLQISEYKRKTKHGGDTHPTVLTVSSRSVLYSDVALLCQHYNAVLKQFGIDPTTAPNCRS
jgi:hypothetical protein